MTAPVESQEATQLPLTVIALVLCTLMAALEATVVSTAMPTAIAELGGVHLYGWVTAAYLIASTVSVPIYGKMADMRGRKPVMLFGIVLFLLGSLASGFSQTIEVLVFFRLVQGLGAGAMAPLAVTVVGDLFAMEKRAKVQSLFSGMWGVTGFLGPLLGGLIVKTLSWRWVFWINLPVGFVSIALLHAAFRERVQIKKRVVDWWGALLLCTFSMLLLLCVNGAKELVLAVPAALVLGLFIWVEKRTQEPIFDLTLFRDPLFTWAAILAALLGGIMMETASFMPLWGARGDGAEPHRGGSSA